MTGLTAQSFGRADLMRVAALKPIYAYARNPEAGDARRQRPRKLQGPPPDSCNLFVFRPNPVREGRDLFESTETAQWAENGPESPAMTQFTQQWYLIPQALMRREPTHTRGDGQPTQ